MLKYLLERLREPSSQVGIGVVINAIVQLAFSITDPYAWLQLVAAIIGVLVPEKPKA